MAPSLLSTQGAKEHQIVCALQMKASALGAQDVRSHLLVLKQCLHQLATFPTQNMLFFGGGGTSITRQLQTSSYRIVYEWIETMMQFGAFNCFKVSVRRTVMLMY